MCILGALRAHSQLVVIKNMLLRPADLSVTVTTHGIFFGRMVDFIDKVILLLPLAFYYIQWFDSSLFISNFSSPWLP